MGDVTSWTTVYETFERRAVDDDRVGAENVDDLRQLLQLKEDQGRRPSTGYDYVSNLCLLFRHVDYRVTEGSEEQLRSLLRDINESKMAVQTDSYTYKSKKAKIESLQALFKACCGGDIPRRARFFKTENLRGQHKRTRPDDIPTIQDIKRVFQSMDNWKYKALFAAHFDAGTRIGEIVKCKVKDFVKNENGRDRLFIRGNKKSDDREIETIISGPVLRLWLDRWHPAPEDSDAMLFCKDSNQGEGHIYEYPRPDSVRSHMYRLDCDLDAEYQKTHFWRKRRQIFLKSVMGLSEIAVARRLGKVPGASNQEYDRLSTDEANREYASAYGYDVDDEDRRDLMPLRCQEEDCGLLNPGWRDRCLDCHGLLEIRELEGQGLSIDEVKEQVKLQVEAIELAGGDVDVDEDELIDRIVDKTLDEA